MIPWMLRVLLVTVLAGIPSNRAYGCSTILAGAAATADGSVLMSHSCDGDVMGLVYVMPARSYPAGTRLPMYRNVPRPRNHAEHQAHVRHGYDVVGSFPVTETYRSLILAGNVESMTTGGLNEHGLCIAIEFLPMRKGLACGRGRVGPNSNHWTSSLIAHGLLRSKTAREAIALIGAMVEEHGFLYYRAPGAGVALPIADRQEVWLMEIFGPGEAWTPDSGRPGGVWCAQRVPDGEVSCSANRSRISTVNLDDPDHFLASTNIHRLAEELGFWKPGQPFVWRDIYGGAGGRDNSLREWRALSLVAPSLALTFDEDHPLKHYPFAVKPDQPVKVPELMEIMRDSYAGTAFDLTAQPAFQVQGGISPLACPWGPPALLALLGLEPERALCTPTSGYVFVAQLRSALPKAVGNLLWFAYGPANTSCFIPLYAGTTDLPDAWEQPSNFTRIDRQQPQWNFRLVHNLTQRLPYQAAMRDIRQVIGPAEACYLMLQPELEQMVVKVGLEAGAGAVESLLNAYARDCAAGVGFAYSELVDYLLLRHLVGDPEYAPPALPRIPAPSVPGRANAGPTSPQPSDPSPLNPAQPFRP